MPWGTQETKTFADELEERGQQRQVEELTEGVFSVHGDPKLSDTFDYYHVALRGRRYECSCYSHAYGDVRRRRICGHVRDVIVWRKQHGGQDRTDQAGEAADSGRPEVSRPPVVSRRRKDRADTNAAPPRLLSPRDPSLGEPPLPDKFTEFRPHQLDAIDEILLHYSRGRRVVFVDAPTGSGKTLIGEIVRRLLEARQGLYVCNNKSLQDQFMEDFSYGALLKGRTNYPTLNHPDDWPEVSAGDCNKRGKEDPQCDECWDVHQCAYLMARNEAEFAPLSVLNTSYLLAAANGARMFRDRNLVICDEADQLESELMRHIEVTVSRGNRNWLHIDLPDSVSDMDSWREWLMMVAGKVGAKAQMLSNRDRKERKRRKGLMELVAKIKAIAPQLDADWVVDGYEDARRRRGTIERQSVRFRPVHVRELAEDYLWQHGEKWLLMSATIISPAQMAESLGLADGTWATVEVPSTFPVEHRPVFLDRHVGPVTRSRETEALPKLVGELTALTGEWDTERILVHTHSYSLTKYVKENLSVGRPIFTYEDSRSREGVLDKWLESTNGILLAPSFDRGVDLYDDRCRVQVIAKAPFPYLGDKQVKKRMDGPGGQVWYVVETIRSIVQATGRIVRSESDYGATYVLDGSVWRLLNENGELFPSWWRESVVKGLDLQSRKIREGFEAMMNP